MQPGRERVRHGVATVSRGAVLAAAALMVARLASAAPAEASPAGALPDRVSLRVSGFFVRETETEFRVDPNVGLGTEVDVDRVLGIPKHAEVVRVDGYFRPASRHRLDFAWYSVRRRGSTRLAIDVNFGGERFAVDEQVDSLVAVDLYTLAYSYSFYRSDEVELALGIGAYVQNIAVRLALPARGRSEARELTAPLPVAGFRLDYAITRQLAARGMLQLFFIDVDRYDGLLTDVELDLEYRLVRNLAVGAGVNLYHLDMNVESGGFTGSFDHLFGGLLVYGALYL